MSTSCLSESHWVINYITANRLNYIANKRRTLQIPPCLIYSFCHHRYYTANVFSPWVRKAMNMYSHAFTILGNKKEEINRKCCHCSTEGRRWQWRMPSLWLPTISIFQSQGLISYVNGISRLHINAGITFLLLWVTGRTVRQSHNQGRICLAGWGV